MKLLIVEDEHKVVDYLRSGLTEQGWVVDIALDGEEGMHLATEFDYDVIVLDVMLPKRDGFSVLKALRMRKSTPVIMLTARDHINDRVRGLREGADDYLTKPFSFLELVERLHALARRTRALLLNARATIEITPKVAKLMAAELGRDAEWVESQVATFTTLAKQYILGPAPSGSHS